MVKKSLLLSGLLSYSGALNVSAQVTELFENFNTVNAGFELPINAISFANYGSFTVSSILPYDTLNTLNFTNRGVMNGSVGFNFQHIASNGTRGPANNFVNSRGAEIIVAGAETSPAFLLIEAENVINHGRFQVGPGGLLRITGENVDLFNAGMEVEPITGSGTSSGTINFIPDSGISDLYWGGITNLIADSSMVVAVAGPTLEVRTPGHSVTNASFFSFLEEISLANPQAFAISNTFNETNKVVQAIFTVVGPGMRTAARFTPSTSTNDLNTALLEIVAPITNVVDGGLDQFSLYLTDTLAWKTNHLQLSNVLAGTFRPATYELSRLRPFEWFSGMFPQDIPIVPELFYGSTYSNTTTTNLYAAYSASVANLVTQPLSLEESTVDDLPGRIEIDATNLDLRNSRFRGEGIVTINADHLIGSAGAVVDSQNVSFNLASTNGVLEVRDVGRMTADRFGGSLRAFSMVWTNQNGTVEEMSTEDPDTGEVTDTSVTNVVNIFHHILVVDARQLQTTVPVFTHDFTANGVNVVVHDDFRIVRSFQSDAEDLDVTGALSFFGEAGNIVATNLPNVRTLEIDGSISVPGLAEFGVGRETPLESFINRGSLTAFSPRIATDYFENSGEIAGGGNVELDVRTAKLDNGNILSGRDITLAGENVKLHEAEVSSGLRIVINVSGVLTDNGPGSNNLLSVGDGFVMNTLPATSDLLGTTIESRVPRFARVDHVWVAEDRGALAKGFNNNAAIGKLVFIAPLGSEVRLSPANGEKNAIYVDRLELRGALAQDWRDTLIIDKGMTLYFADANLSVEELDGAFGGRLRWVRGYAGANSGVDIVVSPDGRTERVNRGLRESLTIDSDGDGTANGIDLMPFDGVMLTDLEVDTDDGIVRTSISWIAAAQTAYQVEYRSGIDSSNWKVFQAVRNEADERQMMTVTDEVSVEEGVRFYRVTYHPR
ncbi:MAG: hypothetical protein M2R45_02107 [Verrucomicrobia subdivision 3 bacterium]|nr:hypothetical protein [Limisphaerales bacterium]MCS1413834.1 hypothetical protein [Limisphaerales bacterium]